MAHLLTRLAKDETAATAILFAVALPPLMTIASLCVDLGSLYLAERRLQNLADAAAAASVDRDADVTARLAVEQMIAESGMDAVQIAQVEEGEYLRDREVSWHDRFDASSLYPNAAHVVLRQEVPLFFGSLITGSNTTFVSAEATASRLDMAGFRLGSSILSLDPGIANSLLSALAGDNLGLTAQQINVLTTTNIDVLDFSQSLGVLGGMDGQTFGEILDTDTALNRAVEAMADAAPDGQSGAILADVAALVGSDFFTPAELIDLGPLAGTDINDGQSGVEVDAYSLLLATLEASHGDSYQVSLDTNIAGLASVNVKIAGGYADERSPWLTVNTANEVTLRTAETRVLINARTGAIAGLPAALNVPFYTELASAEAQMTDIVCRASDGSDGVYVDATPSVGTLAIAAVPAGSFDDFSGPLWLERAELLRTPVLSVTGYSEVNVGGAGTTSLHFTPEDVAAKVSKSAATTDPVTGIASSLAEDVDVNVQALGLGLGLGGVASLVGSTLGTIAPAIDGLYVQLTNALGIKLGTADVTVDRLRCGVPSLVG